MIAAVVIGGTSIYGGEGAIWRTILGVLFLAMIGNGFNLLDIDPTYQQIIQGAIILAAVAVDAWSRPPDRRSAAARCRDTALAGAFDSIRSKRR